jgi:predicted ATPase/signal transduction histidine kinase
MMSNRGIDTLSIPGYRITETIYVSNRTTVYRAYQEENQIIVVIKVLNTQSAQFRDLILFKNQYAIAQQIDHPNIIKCYELERYDNSYALILEDFGGVSLKEYTQSQPLTLGEFFPIAIAITNALECLYQNRIIHKDIKPKNILINPETKKIKLIDFSISSLLPKETSEIKNPNVLEGTLAYMSPEQTGRMNRGIDYRTDYYSLGVTFYELLTGKLPFTSSNPLELVHCHLAKQAINVREINHDIPQKIADILYKLMAKTAEDRYQTARGIKHDLEKCQQMWNSQGDIGEFQLGERDKSERFLISEKLYGRETEVSQLLNAFERVSNGQTELILVAGFSGIGKTALVNEVHKPIVKKKGYFIAGKYDQFQRDIPFSALVQAFRNLMGQLLMESAEKVQAWKQKILTALGEQAQVIIDVIPELEKITGQQPAVAELTGNASQNRFNLLFGEFIKILATQEHPLVIFLDDLQWADAASLKLIQLLMGEISVHYLLLIGAYRDNEVSVGHPFTLTLEYIRKTQVTVNQITLKPLDELHLNQLIADTLNCSESQATSLTQLIFTKTQGNPFFTNQLLKSVQESGLITFDVNAGNWQYDIQKIQASYLNDNVVEFLVQQLENLPETTQNVLKIAACIGNQFDLYTLSIVCQKSELEIASALWKALQEGLILPLNEAYKLYQAESLVSNELWNINRQKLTVHYKFLHDRVQQAAYSLIPETSKQATHLQIGQLLLQNTDQDSLEANIFEVVNQLNFGVNLITNQSERYELAKLNLLGGRKAKSSTAYAAAVRYLNVGLSLLAVDSWQSHYNLTLDLYVEIVESEYLNANFEQSKQLANLTLQQAKTTLDQVRVYRIQILASIAQNYQQEALVIGIEVLKKLGVQMPNKATNLHILAALSQTKLTLFGKSIEDLAALPRMTDPNKLAAIEILSILAPAASQAGSLQFPLIILAMVRLSVKHGNADISAFGYTIYGAMLCDKLGDIETGYQFGQLGLDLLENVNNDLHKCKVYLVFNSTIRHFKEPVMETIAPLIEGLQSGLENGDIVYACYAAGWITNYHFLFGQNLELVDKNALKYLEFTQKLKIEIISLSIAAVRQTSLNLQGYSVNKLTLVGEAFDETEMLDNFNNNSTLLSIYYCSKIILGYLFQNYSNVIKMVDLITESHKSDPGFLMYYVANFYHSLALLAEYNQASTSERKQYLKQVVTNQKQMKLWATHAPCNYKHKYDLVEAEKARVLGKNWLAMDLYDYAIQGAKENKYVQEEAIANELAAKFYLEYGKQKTAQNYMIDAYYGYNNWGAKAKVEDLEKSYPQLLSPILSQKTISLSQNKSIDIITNSITDSSSTSISASLDLETVTKASLAISSEIQLDKLLQTIMQVILENVGAVTASLILDQESELVVVAQCKHEKCELQSTPINNSQNLPISLINYVFNTKDFIIINDANTENSFMADPYILKYRPKSILCVPILNQGQLFGIIYLENTLTVGAFTSDRMQVLKLLSSQIAISLENAQLYTKLEEKVAKRTQQLNAQNLRLEQTLQELKDTQTQLIQTEKMSSLGQMVAGVAHEINNPVSFIHGNLNHVEGYFHDLLTLIKLYQQNATSEIDELLSTIDIDFITEDIPKTLSSMKNGTQRIRDIVLALRNFSRLDEAEMKPANIHEGIDNTLLILHGRLQANIVHSPIKIIKEYGDLPEVECYPRQLNQVFINILGNAIDAIYKHNQELSPKARHNHANFIKIHTQTINNEWVRISIQDNGAGISESVKKQIFDPFFTTKEVGKGTGLGLSVSYQIVVDKHKGKIECISEPGKGAEFILEIPLQQKQ